MHARFAPRARLQGLFRPGAREGFDPGWRDGVPSGSPPVYIPCRRSAARCPRGAPAMTGVEAFGARRDRVTDGEVATEHAEPVPVELGSMCVHPRNAALSEAKHDRAPANPAIDGHCKDRAGLPDDGDNAPRLFFIDGEGHAFGRDPAAPQFDDLTDHAFVGFDAFMDGMPEGGEIALQPVAMAFLVSGSCVSRGRAAQGIPAARSPCARHKC